MMATSFVHSLPFVVVSNPFPLPFSPNVNYNSQTDYYTVDTTQALILQETGEIRKTKANRYRDIPLNKDARNALLTLGFANMAGKSEHVVSGQRGQLTVRGVQLMINRRFEHTDLDFIIVNKYLPANQYS